MMRGDLGHAFNRLISETFIRYQGCLIEKEWGGYKVGKCLFATLPLAKAEIDRQFEVWEEKLGQKNPQPRSQG